MKKHIRQFLTRQFSKHGYSVVKQELTNYPIDALRQHISMPSENRIDSIIFSKDRAMQLHAFTESYFDKVRNSGTLYILYKATKAHQQSYRELQDIWADHDVRFVEEVDFRTQLNSIVEASTAARIGFFVDDMIFTQDVNYNEILAFDPLKYIVCLSRGRDFNYSQVLNKPLVQPTFTPIDGTPYFSFRWDEIKQFSDWTYPLGVSAYFYARAEITAMFNLITYKAPNSLEEAMQSMMPYFSLRYGVCMDSVACCCVHTNLVQQECVNPTTGFASIEDLLDQWSKGKKIDISKFAGVGTNGGYMKYDYIDR